MSNGGARAKEQGKQEEREKGCHLPADLENEFYADVIVIHSKTDEELAKTFLLDIQKHFKKGDNYIIVSYLDEKLRSENAHGCDFKRCSVAFFIFTESSVKEFSSLTKDKSLDNLLYEGKFVPVFTQPKDKLKDLPMRARVPVSLNYFKQTSFQFPRAVLDLLQKHIGTRRAKEECHKEQVSKYLADHSSETITSTSTQPNIYIDAHNVIFGDNGTIVENANLKNSTRKHPRKSNRSQPASDVPQQSGNDTDSSRSRESTTYPSDYHDETSNIHQNVMSMQTPYASMSYCRDEQNLTKTSNRSHAQSVSITSTPTEDFASVEEGHQLPVSNARNMPQAVPIFPNEEFKLSERYGSLEISATREASIEEQLDSRRTERNPIPQQISCDRTFMSGFPSTVSANSIANSLDSEETPNIPWQSKGGTKESTVSNDQKLSMKVSSVDRLAKTEVPWSSHRYDISKDPKEVTENTSDSLALQVESLDWDSLLGTKDFFIKK